MVLIEGTGGNQHNARQYPTEFFGKIKKKYNLPKNITFHSLRHSFATYYLMNGGDLLTLKTMMGHKNLNSTTIYLHMSQDFNNLKGINYGK